MSDHYKIRTNNVPRLVIYWDDLTDKEREDFAYRTADDGAMFVRFCGCTYDLSDFMHWDSGVTPQMEEAGFRKWDGYQGDSHFSGVLCRFVDMNEGQGVVMGTYYS
jgi:hypothetical protein